MAKIPLAVSTALISTVFLTGLVSPSAHATGTLENGLQYWTIQDIIEYGIEAEAARNALCGDDTSCKEQYYYEHMDGGEDRTRYQLLDRFNSTRIWLTSINPSTGAAKFLYQGKDGWAVAMGHDVVSQNLNELYFVWLQGDAVDRYYSNSWFDPAREHYVPDYVDEILSGELPPDTHEIFSYNIERDGYIAYPERTEIDFTISSNANLGANTDGAVYFSNMVGGLRTHGVYNYSSCLSDPNYREGMECRFVFTEDYRQQFVPFAEDGILATAEDQLMSETEPESEPSTEPAPDPELEPNPEPASDPDPEPNQEPTSDTEPELNPEPASEPEPINNIASPTDDNLDDLENREDIIVIADNNTATPHITTPNTGQPTATSEENSAPVFPWWLTAILIINGIAIAWLFWPDEFIKRLIAKNRKNRKIFQKKY